MIIAGSCLLLLCALVFFAVRSNHSNLPPNTGRSLIGGFLSRKDSAEDYILMCRSLLDGIRLVDGVESSDAERAVMARIQQEGMTRIAMEGTDLGAIAQSIQREQEGLKKSLTNLPNARAFFSGSGDVIGGLNSNSSGQFWSGVGQALPEIARGWEAYEKVTESAQFRHGVAIYLATLAPKFSGRTSDSVALTVGFSERPPSFFESDTTQSLKLTNFYGADLHHCVILVRLSDTNGKSHVNIHYAPLWPRTGILKADYNSYEVSTKSLENASRVDVDVWAREFSFEPVTLRKTRGGWLQQR